MNLDAAKQAFYEEGEELLASMEQSLLAVETSDGAVRDEHINAIFRAAHTIKGSAGLFDFSDIVHFTHLCESVLDKLRSNVLMLDAGLIELFLRCRDHIASLIEAVRLGQAAAHDPALEAALAKHLENMGKAPRTVPSSNPIERDDGPHVSNECWHLSLRFSQDVLRNGMDPQSFIRYLGTLGKIAYMSTLYDSMPAPSEMDPELCYLGFELEFAAPPQIDKLTLEGVFEFVREDSRIRILPPHARIADYVRLINELPESQSKLGELLVQGGALTPAELDHVLSIQREQRALGSVQPLGSLLVEEQMAPAQVVTAALDKQRQQAARPTASEHRVVRVDALRLDGLIDLVGELVIAGAAAQLASKGSSNTALNEAVAALSELVERIRDEALSLRMVPMLEIFGRFPRVVRDTARELGKEIELEMSGEDTELDKSMVDKLADPLVHLVRNAIDHGIEAAELRLIRGKPGHGTVWLNAFHESGSVVIEVGDDGGGMDRQRLLKRAVERGLVGEDEILNDQQILQLIFAPGFSTAETITALSGRGVGMDVVKRNIEALKGQIEIESVVGEGSVIRLRLPLTLAIIDGFRVAVGAVSFVIPLDMVVECLDLPAGQVQADKHYLNLRGEVLSFLPLRQLFDIHDPAPARQAVVVVQFGEQRAGLVVDRLDGELQAVIKPLGQLFRGVKGLGGSTILGNGAVALILDVPDLIARATRDERLRVAQCSRQAIAVNRLQ